MRTWIQTLEHRCEKGLLAIALLVMVASAGMYGVRSPNRVSLNGRDLAAHEVNPAIRAAAMQLDEQMRAGGIEPVEFPDYSGDLRRAHAGGVIHALPSSLSADVAARALVVRGNEIGIDPGAAPIVPPVALLTPLAPTQPRVTLGRSVVAPRPATAAAEQTDTAREVSWATVTTSIDLNSLREARLAAGYPQHLAEPIVAELEVERQAIMPDGRLSEWVALPDSAARSRSESRQPSWETTGGRLLNRSALIAARERDQRGITVLLQPAFARVLGGSEWPGPADELLLDLDHSFEPGRDPVAGTSDVVPEPGPELPGESVGAKNELQNSDRDAPVGSIRHVREQLAMVRRALRDDRVDEALALLADAQRNPRARAMQTSIADLTRVASWRKRAAQESAPLLLTHAKTPLAWRHDASLAPGQTCRYRCRLLVWNPHLGRRSALVVPDDAQRVTIASAWSEPSEWVRAVPVAPFFVIGPSTVRPGAATCEVWRIVAGQWVRRQFDAEIGDTVGGIRRVDVHPGLPGPPATRVDVDFSTGAVVLDVRTENVKVRLPGKGNRFSHSARPALVVTYLNPADGQVNERNAALDATDPIRTKLKNESSE